MQPDFQYPAWYLFKIPTGDILNYLEEYTDYKFPDDPAHGHECQKWHLALRRGLQSFLHLDVGMPGIYVPENPIVENECALHAALLLGIREIKVVISGEWEQACKAGLITQDQLRLHEHLMEMDQIHHESRT